MLSSFVRVKYWNYSEIDKDDEIKKRGYQKENE